MLREEKKPLYKKSTPVIRITATTITSIRVKEEYTET